ncbi:MAG: EAL domain-containing protein [Chromatiales bacterium]|nr:EAL domain-containing protein [Chromatiales bacterium]
MKSPIKALRHFWTATVARQLVLGIALVHALLMSIFVFDLVTRQKEFLIENRHMEARGLAETLAANGASWMLASDFVGMEEVIASQSSFPNLRYAMFLSNAGKVMGYTDRSEVGRYINDPTSLRLLDSSAEELLLVDDEGLVDTAHAVKVDDHRIGWARVGLGKNDISASLSWVSTKGLLYTTFAILVGITFAWFMAKGLTGGIRHLVSCANRVQAGETNVDFNLDRADELGELGKDFNLMVERLERQRGEIANAYRTADNQKERLRLAMEAAEDGLWDWNLRDKEVYYSPRWKSMLGFLEEELADTPEEWRERVHPEDRQLAETAVGDHLLGRTETYESTYRMRHKDGHYIWVLSRGKARRDSTGKPYRMIGTHVDLTERKQLEERLFQERERAQVTLESIGDGVITTSRDGRVEYLNPVAEQLTGWSNGEARSRQLEEVFQAENEATGEPIPNPVLRCLREDRVIGLGQNTRLISRSGRHISVEDSAAPIRDRNGFVVGVVLVFHDATERRTLQRHIEHQATHDALTDLWNRRAFEEQLDALQLAAVEQDDVHTLMYLDLDQFKVVNDTVGHMAGDELLRQVTLLLQAEVRESDMLARLGGDEFGVLMRSCEPKQALRTADTLIRQLSDYRFVWEDRSFQIGVSIGLAAIDPGTAETNVLAMADLACYGAKEGGRNRAHVYTPDDQELAQRHGEMHWASRIKDALENGNLILHGQRIMPIGEGEDEPDFREILIRLVDKDGEMVPPGIFLPAAERFGLMPLVDRNIVEQAIAWLAVRPSGSHRLSVNLSATSLGNEQLLKRIEELLDKYPHVATALCLEITETAAIANLRDALSFIKRLKERGVLFALDDFGSGLSSFAYLKTLPVDFLKIDGSFVREMDKDPVDAAMVEAITRVSRTMNIRTIAEFVENGQTISLLRGIGVDYAQGYAIQRPTSLSEGEPPAERATAWSR